MTLKEHVRPEVMKALKAGTLSADEVISVLTHIGECMMCAEVLADSYQTEELLQLPLDFKKKIAARTEREGTAIFNAKSAETRRNRNGMRELYAYSFKVGVAASIALVLLFSGTLDYGVAFGRSIHGDFTTVNKITENLRGFSERLIDFNVKTDFKEVL